MTYKRGRVSISVYQLDGFGKNPSLWISTEEPNQTVKVAHSLLRKVCFLMNVIGLDGVKVMKLAMKSRKIKTKKVKWDD